MVGDRTAPNCASGLMWNWLMVYEKAFVHCVVEHWKILGIWSQGD